MYVPIVIFNRILKMFDLILLRENCVYVCF